MKSNLSIVVIWPLQSHLRRREGEVALPRIVKIIRIDFPEFYLEVIHFQDFWLKPIIVLDISSKPIVSVHLCVQSINSPDFCVEP